MTKIKFLSKKDEEISFIISDTEPSIVNTIRRTIIAEVPTMAIEDINFIQNDTDENGSFIANRIGLIPLFTDLKTIKSFNYRTECICSGSCENCEVFFKLNVINNTDKIVKITAKDLISSNKNVFIKDINLDIEITSLRPTQSLILRASAIKGLGKMHTKWSPVSGNANFTYKPIVSLNKSKFASLENDDIKKIIESCPRKVFDKSGVVNEKACIFCNNCIKESEEIEGDIEDLIKVNPDYTEVTMTIESIGSLTSLDILILSIEHILNNLEEHSSLIDNLKMETI